MQTNDSPPGSPITETLYKMRTEDIWFNDEIMNAFFTLLSKRKYPNVGFLSSYFLHSNSIHWTATQKTLKAFESGELDRILFPFHTPGHWTTVLLASTNNGCTFTVLDSFCEQKEPTSLSNWLRNTFPRKSWQFIVPFKHTHQNDSINCGPYSCLYAELAAKGKSLEEIDVEVTSVNIKTYRQQLLSELDADRSCFIKLAEIDDDINSKREPITNKVDKSNQEAICKLETILFDEIPEQSVTAQNSIDYSFLDFLGCDS